MKLSKLLDYKIVASCYDLPDAPFHTFTLRNSILASKKFLKVVIGNLPEVKIYYIIMYSSGEPIALVCVTEYIIGPMGIKVALCGNPIISADCGVFTREGVARERVLPVVIQTLNEVMDECKVSIVLIKEIASPIQNMQVAGYFRVPTEPVLGVPMGKWLTFEGYVSDMKSHYRGLINKVQRELQNQGVSVVKTDNVTPIIDEIYTLFRNTAQHPIPNNGNAFSSLWDRTATYLTNLPRHKCQPVKKEFFTSLQREFPQETDIIILRKSNQIIGCTINLQDGEVFHSIYMGMNYDDHTPHVYRGLLAAKQDMQLRGRCGLCTSAGLVSRPNPILGLLSCLRPVTVE